MKTRKSIVVLLSIILICSLFSMVSQAEWPEKPIQIIIPWPAPNDPTTIIATAMAPHLSEELGVRSKRSINRRRRVLATMSLPKVARWVSGRSDLDWPDDYAGAQR
jgi:hypothetical protein